MHKCRSNLTSSTEIILHLQSQIYGYLVENHAQSKDVSSLFNVLNSERHFGSAVRRGPLEDSYMARRAKPALSVFAQTKVYDDALSTLFANDVCWFQVAVDDILLK